MRKLLFAGLAGLVLWAAGCGGKIDRPFDLVYLTYGRPDYPMGTLVHVRCEAGVWTRLGSLDLARDAVFLHPPPYPTGVLPFVSVIEAGGELTSALWHWPLAPHSDPVYRLPLTGRVVLLAAMHPTRNRAAICYYSAAQTRMVSAEYERRAVTLGANARCSLAVLDLDRPDSMLPVSACQFVQPAWLPDGGVIFIDRAGRLTRYDPEARDFRTLLSGVRSYSVSVGGRLCAVDSSRQLRFYTPEGAGEGEPIDSVYAPLLSPDGRYLAYQHKDHDLWVRDLESNDEVEIGLGDPRNWTTDSRLVLFLGRRSDERGRLLTTYRVADAATGVSVALPQEGFIVDAVLMPRISGGDGPD